MRITKLLLSVITFCIAINAHGQELYKPYLTLLGMTLEETNLHKIQQALGAAELINEGDTYFAICYVSKEDKATVYFESNELGGPQHRLLSFFIRNDIDDNKNCSPLAANTHINNLGVITLGITIDSISLQLPQPVENIKDYGLLHRHYSKIPFSTQDIETTQIEDLSQAFWSVLIYIEVFEEQGIISAYKVTKLTSW